MRNSNKNGADNTAERLNSVWLKYFSRAEIWLKYG